MLAIENFKLAHLLDLAIGVVVAFVLATLIGAERQWRQRSAGLRTNVLVAVGAAAFVSLGEHLNGNAGARQIAAYVVSGIGFLGAGVIMKEGAHVWGLNTAATLWCSAAVGALSRRRPCRRKRRCSPWRCSRAIRCCVRWSTRSTARRWTKSGPRRPTRFAWSRPRRPSAKRATSSPRRWNARIIPSVKSRSRRARPRERTGRDAGQHRGRPGGARRGRERAGAGGVDQLRQLDGEIGGAGLISGHRA